MSSLLSFKGVDDLVVGEEPGEGGEGGHHPLEGDDRLFHIAVQEQDGSARETARKNCFVPEITSNTSRLTILPTHFLHMPKFGAFVMSGIVK